MQQSTAARDGWVELPVDVRPALPMLVRGFSLFPMGRRLADGLTSKTPPGLGGGVQ
jgi:hypothetical protein